MATRTRDAGLVLAGWFLWQPGGRSGREGVCSCVAGGGRGLGGGGHPRQAFRDGFRACCTVDPCWSEDGKRRRSRKTTQPEPLAVE